MGSILYFIADAVLGTICVASICCAIGYLLGSLCGFICIRKHGWHAFMIGTIYGGWAVVCCLILWGLIALTRWGVSHMGYLSGAFAGGCLIAIVGSWRGIPALIVQAIEKLRPELASKAQSEEFILSSEKEIYLYRDEQQVGPFDEIDLRMWMVEGKVDANEWAWRKGQETWLPLMKLLTELTKAKLASREK